MFNKKEHLTPLVKNVKFIKDVKKFRNYMYTKFDLRAN